MQPLKKWKPQIIIPSTTILMAFPMSAWAMEELTGRFGAHVPDMPAAAMSACHGVGNLLHFGFAEARLDINLNKNLDKYSSLPISKVEICWLYSCDDG